MEQFTVMAGLGAITASAGLALLVVGLIFLIVRIINKKPKKPAVILIVIAVLLTVPGAFTFTNSMSNLSTDIMSICDIKRIESAEAGPDGSFSLRLQEFSYTDDSGCAFNNSTLKDYRYTVINWWEPWCGHCKNEMPALDRLYEEYKARGIGFVGIYSDEKDAERVIAEYGISYPTVKISFTDDCPFSLIYTGGVPLTVIADSEGRLVPLGVAEETGTPGNGSPELAAAYDCIVTGERSYEFWKEKLDALTG